MGMLIAYILGILTAVQSDHEKPLDRGEPTSLPNRPFSAMAVSPVFSENEKTKKKKENRRKTIKFWVSFATLVVLAIYTGFTVLIWCSQKEANRIATDGFVAAQRAYITHRGIKHVFKTTINPSGKQVKSFDFFPQWENAGNTPAIGVLGLSGSSVFVDEITEAQFMGKVQGSPRPTAIASIGPKQPWETEPTHEPEAFATEDLQYSRYMWGWLLYRDVFPNTKVHLTEYCFKSTSITPRGSDYDFQATVCRAHNCVDEFCEDYSTIVAIMPD